MYCGASLFIFMTGKITLNLSNNFLIVKIQTCYFPGTGTGLTSSASAAARTLIRTTDAPKIKMSRPMALEKHKMKFFSSWNPTHYYNIGRFLLLDSFLISGWFQHETYKFNHDMNFKIKLWFLTIELLVSKIVNKLDQFPHYLNVISYCIYSLISCFLPYNFGIHISTMLDSSVRTTLCSLGTRPSKIEREGLVNGDGVEVYTVLGMQAYFWLAFDQHSDVHLLEKLTARFRKL